MSVAYKVYIDFCGFTSLKALTMESKQYVLLKNLFAVVVWFAKVLNFYLLGIDNTFACGVHRYIMQFLYGHNNLIMVVSKIFSNHFDNLYISLARILNCYRH